MSEQDSLLLVQVSDTHLLGDRRERFKGVDTQATLEQVLRLIRSKHPDAARLLVTGDVSQDGSEHSYRIARHLLQETGLPISVLPGNHDRPDVMQAEFPAQWLRPVIDETNWRIVQLNTAVVGAEYGGLSESQLMQLTQAVATRGDRRLLIAMHHHPMPVGSRWIDDIGLRDASRLLALLPDDDENILIFGHIHQVFEKRHSKAWILGTPSTAVQFLPRSDGFALDDRPPGYRWLRLFRSGSAESGIVRLS